MFEGISNMLADAKISNLLGSLFSYGKNLPVGGSIFSNLGDAVKSSVGDMSALELLQQSAGDPAGFAKRPVRMEDLPFFGWYLYPDQGKLFNTGVSKLDTL